MKKEKISAEPLILIGEAARILGKDRTTLWRWDQRGILKAIRVGNIRVYRLADIEKLKEQTHERA